MGVFQSPTAVLGGTRRVGKSAGDYVFQGNVNRGPMTSSGLQERVKRAVLAHNVQGASNPDILDSWQYICSLHLLYELS